MQFISENQQKVIKRILLSQKQQIKEILLKPSKEKILKQKIAEIEEILYDPIINRD